MRTQLALSCGLAGGSDKPFLRGSATRLIHPLHKKRSLHLATAGYFLASHSPAGDGAIRACLGWLP